MNRTPDPGASPPLRLELPTPFPVGTVNAYFLAGAEPTLIDPGLSSAESLEALRRQLAQHGHSLDEVRRILVTHGHLDHAGAAQLLSRQCRAVLCRHRQDTLLAHGLPELAARRRAFLGRCGLPEATAREAVASLRPGHTPADPEVEPWAVELLQGGESVPAGAGVLEVLAIPGHSPDHLGFLNPASRELFCGDTLLPHITPNPMLAFDPEQGFRRTPSLLAYLDTLAQLALLDLRRGHPGHGETIHDVPRLIARNQAQIARRAEALLRRLVAAPHTPHDLALAVFGRRDPLDHYLALSEVVAYLDLLERDGAVVVDWEGEPIVARAVRSTLDLPAR